NAELAKDKAALDSTQSAITQMKARLATYQKGRLDDLKLQLAHAVHRVTLLEHGASDDADAPATEMNATAQNDAGQSPQEPTLARDRAQERVQRLRNEIALVQQGVYIGDSYNDAPYSEQNLTQLQAAADQLQGQITQDQRRIDIMTTRVKREQVRVNALRGGEIDSPVNGLFWEELASDNEDVQRGDALLRLVNCDSVVITASVPETTYDRLTRGQAVDFRPLGQDKSFSGTIVRLAGAGARTVYTNLAVAPSEKHLQRYDVTISVPGMKSDPHYACAIGRTGRVFFDSRPLDWLRRLGL
ncbi:HlyD family efflux transporter periplasmic adaptor subunit, partial [Thioclava sp. BHET1]